MKTIKHLGRAVAPVLGRFINRLFNFHPEYWIKSTIEPLETRQMLSHSAVTTARHHLKSVDAPVVETLNKAWSGTGRFTTDFRASRNDRAMAMALQENGMLVVAGSTTQAGSWDFGISRYTPMGPLDGDFGQAGRVTTDFTSGSLDQAYALALSNDGKIILGGYTCENKGQAKFALARYNSDGSLDATFGAGGKIITAIGELDARVKSLAIDPDGDIIAAGYALDGDQGDFAVARYTTSGNLDPSFGDNGIFVLDLYGGDDRSNAMAIAADGKIVLGGSGMFHGGDRDFALVRLNADGTPDLSFTPDGKLHVDYGGNDSINALIIQSDGRIVVGGVTNGHPILARRLANGRNDVSFNGDGKLILDSSGKIQALTLDQQGNIVAVGAAVANGGSDFSVMRIEPNGEFDASFSGDGYVHTNFSSSMDEARAVVIEGRRIVVGGVTTSANQSNNFALAGYKPDGALDAKFSPSVASKFLPAEAPRKKTKSRGKKKDYGQNTDYSQNAANLTADYFATFSLGWSGASCYSLDENSVYVWNTLGPSNVSSVNASSVWDAVTQLIDGQACVGGSENNQWGCTFTFPEMASPLGDGVDTPFEVMVQPCVSGSTQMLVHIFLRDDFPYDAIGQGYDAGIENSPFEQWTFLLQSDASCPFDGVCLNSSSITLSASENNVTSNPVYVSASVSSQEIIPFPKYGWSAFNPTTNETAAGFTDGPQWQFTPTTPGTYSISVHYGDNLGGAWLYDGSDSWGADITTEVDTPPPPPPPEHYAPIWTSYKIITDPEDPDSVDPDSDVMKVSTSTDTGLTTFKISDIDSGITPVPVFVSVDVNDNGSFNDPGEMDHQLLPDNHLINLQLGQSIYHFNVRLTNEYGASQEYQVFNPIYHLLVFLSDPYATYSDDTGAISIHVGGIDSGPRALPTYVSVDINGNGICTDSGDINNQLITENSIFELPLEAPVDYVEIWLTNVIGKSDKYTVYIPSEAAHAPELDSDPMVTYSTETGMTSIQFGVIDSGYLSPPTYVSVDINDDGDFTDAGEIDQQLLPCDNLIEMDFDNSISQVKACLSNIYGSMYYIINIPCNIYNNNETTNYYITDFTLLSRHYGRTTNHFNEGDSIDLYLDPPPEVRPSNDGVLKGRWKYIDHNGHVIYLTSSNNIYTFESGTFIITAEYTFISNTVPKVTLTKSDQLTITVDNISPTIQLGPILYGHLKDGYINRIYKITAYVDDPGLYINCNAHKIGNRENYPIIWDIKLNGNAYYHRENVLSINDHTSYIDFLPDQCGTYTVTVTVNDGYGGITTVTDTIKVIYTLNASITYTPTSPSEGSTISLSSSVESISPSLSYSWNITPPAKDHSGSSTPNLTFIPNDDGKYTVTLNVNDGLSTCSATTTINVENVPPQATISGPPIGALNDTATWTSSVTDMGTNDLVRAAFAWSVLRSGYPTFTLPSETVTNQSTFSFTPDQLGTYTITFRVTDKDGGTCVRSLPFYAAIDFSITDIPALPKEGEAIKLSSEIIGPSSLTRNWTITLPDMSTCSGGSGKDMTFTPLEDGDYIVSLQINGDYVHATKEEIIHVSNVPPSVTINGSMRADTLSTTVYTCTVTDPGENDLIGASYAWTVERQGAQISSATTSDLPFYPQESGVYHISLIVTDNDLDSTTRSLEVLVGNPPTIADMGPVDFKLPQYSLPESNSPMWHNGDLVISLCNDDNSSNLLWMSPDGCGGDAARFYGDDGTLAAAPDAAWSYSPYDYGYILRVGDVTFDVDGNLLYAAGYNGIGMISASSLQPSWLRIPLSKDGFGRLAVDAAGNILTVSPYLADCGPLVERVIAGNFDTPLCYLDALGAQVVPSCSTSYIPTSLIISSDQHTIYSADFWNDKSFILKSDLNSGETTQFYSFTGYISGMAYLPGDGGILVAGYDQYSIELDEHGDLTWNDQASGFNAIYRISSDGQLVQAYDAGPVSDFQTWSQVAVDPSGQSFWVTAHEPFGGDPDNLYVYHFDLETGTLLNRLTVGSEKLVLPDSSGNPSLRLPNTITPKNNNFSKYNQSLAVYSSRRVDALRSQPSSRQFHYQVNGSDPDGLCELHYVFDSNFDSNNPLAPINPVDAVTGAYLNPVTGELTWTPTGSGEYKFNIRAVDPQGFSSEVETLIVNAGYQFGNNNAPRFTTTTDLSPAILGRPYINQIQATDDDGDPLTYSLAAGSDITIDSSLGVLQFTPNANDESRGYRDVAVTVTDPLGVQTQGIFHILILRSTVAPTAADNDIFDYFITQRLDATTMWIRTQLSPEYSGGPNIFYTYNLYPDEIESRNLFQSSIPALMVDLDSGNISLEGELTAAFLQNLPWVDINFSSTKYYRTPHPKNTRIIGPATYTYLTFNDSYSISIVSEPAKLTLGGEDIHTLVFSASEGTIDLNNLGAGYGSWEVYDQAGNLMSESIQWTDSSGNSIDNDFTIVSNTTVFATVAGPAGGHDLVVPINIIVDNGTAGSFIMTSGNAFIEGLSRSDVTVASFVLAAGSDITDPTGLVPTIDWDDGSKSQGHIVAIFVGEKTVYEVRGAHRYNTSSYNSTSLTYDPYTVKVVIPGLTSLDGVTNSNGAIVSDSILIFDTLPGFGTLGEAFTNPVATFYDTNLYSDPSRFKAKISWDNVAFHDAQIQQMPDGSFRVIPKHVDDDSSSDVPPATTTGLYPITVQIFRVTQDGGERWVETKQAYVLLGNPDLDAPQGLQAPSSGSGTDLSWDAVSDATRYLVYRYDINDAIVEDLTPEGISGTVFFDESCTSGHDYYYCVVAKNDTIGCSMASDWVIMGSAPIETSYPLPTNLISQANPRDTETGIVRHGVNITWDSVSNVDCWVVYKWKWDSNLDEWIWENVVNPITDTHDPAINRLGCFDDQADFSGDEILRYSVVSYSDTDKEHGAFTVNDDQVVVQVPTGLEAHSYSDGIQVNWNDRPDEQDDDWAGWNVYRRSVTRITVSDTSPYTLTASNPVAAGTEITVKAVGGGSLPRGLAVLTTYLVASYSTTDKTITLKDYDGNPVVIRPPLGGGEFDLISDWFRMNSAPITSFAGYNDIISIPGLTYEYALTAIGSLGGETCKTAPVRHRRSISAEPLTPTGLSAHVTLTCSDPPTVDIIMSWNPVTTPLPLEHADDAIDHYNIYRCNPSAAPETNASSWELIDKVLPGSTPSTPLSYTDLSIPAGQLYKYRVSAVDGDEDESAWSDPIMVNKGDGVSPNQPTIITADCDVDNITLTWTGGLTDAQEANGSYQIYRLQDGNYKKLDALSGTDLKIYRDSNLSPGTTYHYFVAAFDENDDFSMSDEFIATTSDATSPSIHLEPIYSGSTPMTITADTPIYGAVSFANSNINPGTRFMWKLSLLPLGTSGTPIVLASDTKNVGMLEQNQYAQMGIIRPTMLQDGLYQIKLEVIDQTGVSLVTPCEQKIQIQTMIKAGGLSLSFTDLSVTTPDGQQLTLTRSYDSTRIDEPDEEGFLAAGWRLNLLGAQSRDTVSPESNAMHTGDRLYLTLPGGDELQFLFIPKPNGYDSTQPFGTLYPQYRPQFLSVDGSGTQLTLDRNLVLLRGTGGDFTIKTMDAGSLENQIFNPRLNAKNVSNDGTLHMHYILTTLDGVTYTINPETGYATQSIDRNGNVTTYASDTLSVNAGNYHLNVTSVSGVVQAKIMRDSQQVGGIIKYYLTESSDGKLELTSMEDQVGITTSFQYHASHRLVEIADSNDKPIVTATYDELGRLNSMSDSRGNSSSAMISSFDGQQMSCGATLPDDGATPLATEQIADSRGNVIRQIQTLLDPNKAVIGYVVTVHDYVYAGDDLYDLNKDGVSSVNRLAMQTDWLPFTKDGDDPLGLRYTQAPDTMAQVVTYKCIATSNGDPSWRAVDDKDLWLPATETTFSANGQPLTTTYSNYVYGQPGLITDPYGNTTENIFDTWYLDNKYGQWYDEVTDQWLDDSGATRYYNGMSGNLTCVISPDGTKTWYTYTSQKSYTYNNSSFALDYSNLPNGLLLETIRDGIVVSRNVYYTSDSYGGYIGKLSSTTDISGVTTSYTYTSDGNINEVSTSWLDNKGAPHVSISSITQYDDAGRVASVANAAGYLMPNGYPTFTTTSTTYDNMGRVDTTIDIYGGITTNLYDGLGRLICIQYPDHTEVRTVYDTLGRAEWTCERYLTTSVTGMITAGCAADATCISVDGFLAGTILHAGDTLYLPDYGQTYAVTENVVLSNGAGDIHISPPLAQDIDVGVSAKIYDNVTHSILTHTIYDTVGRVTGTERYSGLTIKILPDDRASSSSMTEVNADGASPFSQTSTLYNSAGRVYQTIDAGDVVTTTEYYPNGQVKIVTTEAGTEPSQTTTYDYDHMGKLITLENYTEADLLTVNLFYPDGAWESATSDDDGDDTGGVMARLCNNINDKAKDASPDNIFYHVNAMILSDGAFALFSIDDSLNIEDLVLKIEVYNNSNGMYQPITPIRCNGVWDAANNRTIQVSDNLGRNILTIYPDNTISQTLYYDSPLPVSSYTPQDLQNALDVGGRVEEHIQQHEIGSPDDQLVRVFHEYDAAGRLRFVYLPPVPNPNNADAMTWPRWSYTYDPRGLQLTQTDPNGHTTSFAYDDLGRRISRTLPDGSAESWTYDSFGRLSTHTDFNGHVTLETYCDSGIHVGQLDTEYRGANLTTGQASEKTVYHYDELNRVTGVTESIYELVWVAELGYQYYWLQTREETTDYDPVAGAVSQTTSPEGTVNHEYDAETGRLIRTYTGLADPDGTSTQGDGKAVTDTRYGYDSFGRLNTVTVVERNDTPLATPEVTSYYYDSADRLDASLTNGVSTDYVYDSLNRLTEMTNFTDADDDHVYDSGDPGEAIIGRYVYVLDERGDKIQATETDDKANTRVFYWTYDADGRLISEVYDGPNDTVTNNDYIVTYEYDLAGNRLHQYTQHAPSDAQIGDFLSDSSLFTADEAISYIYDVNDRLKTEVKDAAGTANDSKTVYSYGSINSGPAMTEKTVHAGTDGSGSLIETDTYVYDLRGRMTQSTVTIGSVSTSTVYEYNSSGMRCGMTTSSTDGTTTTSTSCDYLVDMANPTGYAQTLEEWSGRTLEKSYTLGLDVISQSGSAHGVLTLAYDGHGNTRAVVSTTGVEQRYVYDDFGTLISGIDGVDILTSNLSAAWTTLLYSGEQTDSITHLQYLRARYYDPRIGRFGSQDNLIFSAGDTGNANLYLYCGGNPVNGRDPSGYIFEGEFDFSSLGRAVHSAIEDMYESTHIGIIRCEKSIPGIGGTLMPDIMDLTPGVNEIGEIKPLSPYGIATGPAQLAGYLIAANTFLGGGWKGSTWSVGVQEVPIINPTFNNWVVFTLGNTAGIIWYRAFRKPNFTALKMVTVLALSKKLADICDKLLDKANAQGGRISEGEVVIANYQMDKAFDLAMTSDQLKMGATFVGVAAVLGLGSYLISRLELSFLTRGLA